MRRPPPLAPFAAPARALLAARARALLAALAALAAAALAPAAAPAAFFPGTPVDGPNPLIRALGNVELARDGTGALAYVREAEGADRAFVARFAGGIFHPPERIDGGLAGASSQPVVAAADGGRLVAAFVNGGVVYGTVRPAGQGWLAPVPLSAGSDPDVDLSVNGTAYATFAALGDVRVARLDRRTNAWGVLAQPADVVPAQVAGTGGGRPRVAISADGVGVVTWGEGGHVYARKMFGAKLSDAPQDLTPPVFEDRLPVLSDLPDVDAEFDSSYAWVVFRQHFADGGSRTLARRQRGTAFDPPVAVDAGGEPTGEPRIDLNGRGAGIATTAGALTGQPMGALLARDRFAPAARAFTAPVALPAVAPAYSDNDDGLIAAALGAPGEVPYVRAQAIEGARAGEQAILSSPALGAVVPQLGFDAASDRAGGFVVAWLQSAPEGARIMAGYRDRPPGTFVGNTSQRCCKTAAPLLSWAPAFELWGPIRYVVSVDGKVVGETTGTRLQLSAPLPGPTHEWQVQALDVRGQARRSRTRRLRIDGLAPVVTVRYDRSGRVVTISARARDPRGRGRRSSGVRRVTIAWGDGSRAARGAARVRARHRYGRRGTFRLRVIAVDRAGNETVSTRRVRIR